MKIFAYCLFICLLTVSCGENFLKLASEIGNYSTQQFRDIEEMRKVADRCDYEKKCFKEEVDIFIRELCTDGEYNKRGYISENECERQYPYVFLKLFDAGKYASIDGIQAEEKYREAKKKYEEALKDIEDEDDDYKRAKEDWEDAQKDYEEQDYENAKEDWEDAQKDYDEAWEDYNEAWEDYEKAKNEYTSFLYD